MNLGIIHQLNADLIQPDLAFHIFQQGDSEPPSASRLVTDLIVAPRTPTAG